MSTTTPASCRQCDQKDALDFDFSMAFQPIVDVSEQRVFAYEALVRGLQQESAYSVLSKVHAANRYQFDQQCRVKAITLAAQLGMQEILSINFLPNAIYQPQLCLRTTLDTAGACAFPLHRIMFEFTEVEKIEDVEHIKTIVAYYKSLNFLTAIDDYGAGYSGLNLLADFQTQIIKLDMALIRNIHEDKVRQAIVRSTLSLFAELNITPIAEGIEGKGEAEWLHSAGVTLMQGYYFAKPAFEQLPPVDFSDY